MAAVAFGEQVAPLREETRRLRALTNELAQRRDQQLSPSGVDEAAPVPPPPREATAIGAARKERRKKREEAAAAMAESVDESVMSAHRANRTVGTIGAWPPSRTPPMSVCSRPNCGGNRSAEGARIWNLLLETSCVQVFRGHLARNLTAFERMMHQAREHKQSLPAKLKSIREALAARERDAANTLVGALAGMESRKEVARLHMEQMERELMAPTPTPAAENAVWAEFKGSWGEPEDETSETGEQEEWWSSKYSVCPGSMISHRLKDKRGVETSSEAWNPIKHQLYAHWHFGRVGPVFSSVEPSEPPLIIEVGSGGWEICCNRRLAWGRGTELRAPFPIHDHDQSTCLPLLEWSVVFDLKVDYGTQASCWMKMLQWGDEYSYGEQGNILWRRPDGALGMFGIFSSRSTRLHGEIAIVCDEAGARMTIYEDLEVIAQLGPFGEWGTGPVFSCPSGFLTLGDHENQIHQASMSYLCTYPRALSFRELQEASSRIQGMNQDDAAKRIQSKFRRGLWRRNNSAAVRLQQWVRCWVARSAVQALRVEREVKNVVRELGVGIIQTHWRANRARERASERREAILTFQRCRRGLLGRKRVTLLHKLIAIETAEAAAAEQAAVEAAEAAAAAQKAAEEAAALEIARRAAEEASAALKAAEAAAMLEASLRAEAALTLQRCCRGLFGRRDAVEYKAQRAAAQKAQEQAAAEEAAAAARQAEEDAVALEAAQAKAAAEWQAEAEARAEAKALKAERAAERERLNKQMIQELELNPPPAPPKEAIRSRRSSTSSLKELSEAGLDSILPDLKNSTLGKRRGSLSSSQSNSTDRSLEMPALSTSELQRKAREEKVLQRVKKVKQPPKVDLMPSLRVGKSLRSIRRQSLTEGLRNRTELGP